MILIWEPRLQTLTQHSDLSGHRLHHEDGRSPGNAPLQAGTPGPDLLGPGLLPHRHFKRTEGEKRGRSTRGGGHVPSPGGDMKPAGCHLFGMWAPPQLMETVYFPGLLG